MITHCGLNPSPIWGQTEKHLLSEVFLHCLPAPPSVGIFHCFWNSSSGFQTHQNYRLVQLSTHQQFLDWHINFFFFFHNWQHIAAPFCASQQKQSDWWVCSHAEVRFRFVRGFQSLEGVIKWFPHNLVGFPVNVVVPSSKICWCTFLTLVWFSFSPNFKPST